MPSHPVAALLSNLGTAVQIQARRTAVFGTAYTVNPEQIRRRLTPPPLPTKAWINQPPPPSRRATTQPTRRLISHRVDRFGRGDGQLYVPRVC
jgi:hypothetical protein